MSRKKAQPAGNSTKIRTTILDAAINMAARTPWEFVSLLEIAQVAGMSVDDVRCHFYTKSDMVAAIIDDLDTQVEAAFPAAYLESDESIPVRDRLFDVLMERIDLANRNRAAHISFFKSFGWTKESSCADLRLLRNSMTRMAKCAGIETDGIFGAVRVAGLSLAYVWVLLTWARDTSPDLGKTMAELDRTLGRVDGIADYLTL